MRRSTLALLSVVVALGLFAVGCDSAGPNATEDPEGSGTLQMLLTDAPGDILEANVVIESVSIVPVEDSANGDSTDTGISVLSENDFAVDLTKLQNGVDTLMAELEVSAGTYSQVRLQTASPDDFTVMYEDENGDPAEANLFIPSGEQTGIKVNFDEPFTVDGETDLTKVTLDFSVEESFVKRGQSGSYNFKPTVTATVDTSGSGI